ncbi:MAG: DUF1501 domain-containing protein [Lacipirellulaceae bacterium]
MFSRRQILQAASSGFGYLAFAGLSSALAAKEAKSLNPLSPKAPHFPATAKRVIFLFMQGGPSHVDTFDYKPQLSKDHGKQGKYGGSLLGSPFEFHQRGDSGLWISELFKNVGNHADDLTLIRGMQCDQPVHPNATIQMHTGTAQFIRPSLGSWTVYGLGTENESMPGFISMSPANGAGTYASAFLPSVYSGARIGRGGRRGMPAAGGETVPDIKSPHLDERLQRRQLDFVQALNREKLAREQVHPEVEGAIESFELAFRMQGEMPELMDLSGETKETLAMYGVNEGPTDNFGKQCLLARRFAEAGVRFIEVTFGGWDQHANLTTTLRTRAEAVDKPIAGLLQDLKQRDLLKDTLVIWGGEFGRTPASQGPDGRNHNNKGFTTWMAGGGVKGGFSYGATDEHGYEAVDRPCHVHDWHATILHLLGLDHEQLTYRYGGRDYRLTDVHGNVAKEIIA